MKTVIFAILSPSIVLTSFGQQHLPTILLKQAADELLESPFTQEALKQDKLSGLAKGSFQKVSAKNIWNFPYGGGGGGVWRGHFPYVFCNSPKCI